MYVQYDLTHSDTILPSKPLVVFFFSIRSVTGKKKGHQIFNKQRLWPAKFETVVATYRAELTLILLCNFETAKCLAGGRVKWAEVEDFCPRVYCYSRSVRCLGRAVVGEEISFVCSQESNPCPFNMNWINSVSLHGDLEIII